jgi:hypothetical protein
MLFFFVRSLQIPKTKNPPTLSGRPLLIRAFRLGCHQAALKFFHERRTSCQAILASSQEKQFPYEGAPFHNGYFTHFLLEALHRNNGMNTNQQDYDYMKGQLPQSRGLVHPGLARRASEERFSRSRIPAGNASPRAEQQRVRRGHHFGRANRVSVTISCCAKTCLALRYNPLKPTFKMQYTTDRLFSVRRPESAYFQEFVSV